MLRTKTVGVEDTVEETRSKLNTAGVAVPFEHLDDMWYKYLGEQGHVGSLNDRVVSFLEGKTLTTGALSDMQTAWDGSL